MLESPLGLILAVVFRLALFHGLNQMVEEKRPKLPASVRALLDPFVVHDFQSPSSEENVSPDRPWPKDLPLPNDYVFALGVVALNYGQLEAMFQALFAAAIGLNEVQLSAIFQRLDNERRREALSQIVGQTKLPDGMKADIAHFSAGFKVCAENRHALMHSRSGGLFHSADAWGLVLHKNSKSGVRLTCYATLKDLRRVADDSLDYTLYGSRVISDVHSYLARPRDFEKIVGLGASHGRPPLPIPLTWSTEPPTENPSGQPPPESSPG